MNWFSQHPNWTMFFGWVFCSFMGAGFSAGTESIMEVWGIILVLVLAALGITVWGLRAKGRNPAWALLHFVPFGWIFILMLENKRY